jgi:hypothetical protein
MSRFLLVGDFTIYNLVRDITYNYLGWVLTWKYLKQGFWGEIYIYIRGLHSVQSGVLLVYYSDHAAIYSILQ